MGFLAPLFATPRRARWTILTICFAAGLLVGWILGKIVLN